MEKDKQYYPLIPFFDITNLGLLYYYKLENDKKKICNL